MQVIDCFQIKDYSQKVLGQFRWVSLNGETAKLIAELNAYLLSKG